MILILMFFINKSQYQKEKKSAHRIRTTTEIFLIFPSVGVPFLWKHIFIFFVYIKIVFHF